MKRSLRGILIAVVATAFLSSCWLPEDFDARVLIAPDGSYTFTYEGVLSNVLALEAISKDAFTEENDAEVREQGAELKKEPGFTAVDYLGRGRFKVSVRLDKPAGKTCHFLSKDIKLFSVEAGEDKTLSVTSFMLEENDLESLRAIGGRTKGTFTVQVPNKLKVLSENADKKQKEGKTAKNYIWNIDDPLTAAKIVVRL
ncbi:MAG: hypothetical protein JXR21_02465 [Candidatus Marinimicrobia bacterium]|nr:hypothetical protein [Candidatus Neomarinimicrobiota bacterium]